MIVIKTIIIMKCITFFKLFFERILNGAATLASPASFSVLVSFIKFVHLVWSVVCARVCTIPHTLLINAV